MLNESINQEEIKKIKEKEKTKSKNI